MVAQARPIKTKLTLIEKNDNVSYYKIVTDMDSQVLTEEEIVNAEKFKRTGKAEVLCGYKIRFHNPEIILRFGVKEFVWDGVEQGCMIGSQKAFEKLSQWPT